jgi:ClpP class serine protease
LVVLRNWAKLNCSFEVQVGYSKEVISRGKYAEVLEDYRPFSEEEEALFNESAEFAYKTFRNRAAISRKMKADEMQELAQGRVWSGHRAQEHRCGLLLLAVLCPSRGR